MYLNKFAPVFAGQAELDCSSTANLDTYMIPTKLRITRLQALVTTVMVSTGTITLNFYRRPTHGSTSGEVLIGSVIVPATQAVGKTIYKDVGGVDVYDGEEVVCKVNVAATTSGKVFSSFIGNEEAEVPANISNLIASA